MVGDSRSHVCAITTMHKTLTLGALFLLFEELKVMNMRESAKNKIKPKKTITKDMKQIRRHQSLSPKGVSINCSLNEHPLYIHLFAKDTSFASFRIQPVSKIHYILKFQISYPFAYSIIILSIYIVHHPHPVLDVRISLIQFITIVVHHSLNNIHKCITHACALKWRSLELEKKKAFTEKQREGRVNVLAKSKYKSLPFNRHVVDIEGSLINEVGERYPETPDQRGEEVSELFIRCGVLLYDPKSNLLQTNFSKTLEGILPLQHHVRCNTVLETSLAVRDPSPLSFGRCASDPRGFDVEKRRTYAEPSRRALPVPITKSSSHRRRVRDPCRAAGAFINSRRSRDHNRAMRRRHDLNWSCGV
ncbi:hypothetical protein YC2023_048618 [Brassica napus]